MGRERFRREHAIKIERGFIFTALVEGMFIATVLARIKVCVPHSLGWACYFCP
jgi:hypothetical protein